MFIYEILSRKKYLDNKLNDIDNYIVELSTLNVDDKSTIYNKAIEIKFTLLSKIRSHKVLIQEQNSINTVVICGNVLSVYDAVKLRETLLEKLRTLDLIIRSGDLSIINIFNIMDQRDVIFEEYTVLDSKISESDSIIVWEKGEN